MKKITNLFSAAACLVLFVLPSCKKIGGWPSHPGHHVPVDSVCKLTKISLTGFYGNADEYLFAYTPAGNPDSIVDNNPLGNLGNPRFFFRYDGQDRLTDYMLTNQANSTNGAYFAFSWHKYAYPTANYVTDTALTYAGDIRIAAPVAASVGTDYSISAYDLDTLGRIVRVWSIKEFTTSPHAPVLAQQFVYDAAGNLPLSDSSQTYDNKTNFLQTNKVLAFISRNYSRNNVIRSGSSFVSSYNGSGLPLTLENLNPDFAGYFNLYNIAPDWKFSYACSAPTGPVHY